MTPEPELLSPLAHLRSDPRASSTQSLVPSELDRDAAGKPSAGRRRLLLIYVHGFYGNDQSFQSFPAHVHSFLREALAETHVIHSKIYPRYKTYRAVGVGAENFSTWLEPHEDEGTDVVLVGHSMGGILAAEVVLMPNPDPFRPHPYKHRILGLIAMDTPFLGLHPRIIPTGIASLFRKDDAASPEEQIPSLTVSTAELSVEPTTTSNDESTTPPTTSPPVVSPPVPSPSSPSDPLLHDPTFNPPFHNDVHLRTRTRLTSLAHFAQKHFSEGLIPAAGRHILSHMEYAACLADYRELHARYADVRGLEDIDPLRDLGEAMEREVVEGPSFRARAARVRFVNYYTAATGRPKKEKEKKDKEEKEGGEKEEDRANGEGQDSEEQVKNEKDKERRESGSGEGRADGGSTPRLSVDMREESSAASIISYDSSKPPSVQTSTLDGSSAASFTTFDTMPSTNSDPSLPAAPPHDAPLPNPGSRKKEAFRSAYDQALRLSRRKLLKQASKFLEKRDPSSSLPISPPPPYPPSASPCSPPPPPPRREPPPPFTAPHNPSPSDRQKPQSTCPESMAPKMRKFCATPKKSYGVDRTWVSVPMRDIDEVDAHVSMFFAENAHYAGLVADAGRRVVGWVQEDAIRREVEAAAGL